MGKQPKQDSRQYLNKALGFYYNATGSVMLSVEFEKNNIPFGLNKIWAITKTLEKDGHISLIQDSSITPVGMITGQGMVFFEQGGYKDHRSRVDKMIHWFKDNKFFSIIIITFIALTSLFGVLNIILEVVEWLN